MLTLSAGVHLCRYEPQQTKAETDVRRGKAPRGSNSFWSLIKRPGSRWDNHGSSHRLLLYPCDWETSVCNPLTFIHLAALCFCTHRNICTNVCVCGPVYAHVHTFVSPCSHICLCYSSHRCLTRCLSERRAKINIWGQTSHIYELCLYGVQADLRVCVFVLLDMCVCVYKPRRSLSPGSNLGLYRGDIRFPIPPHTCVCVSAAVAVIETVGTLCVCVSVCLMKMGAVCVWWQGTQSPVSKRQSLDQVRPLKLSSFSALKK